MQARIFGTVNDSIVDAPGLRYVIFFQGCPHRCPGCHNPGSHDPDGGELRSVDELLDEIRVNPLLSGVTFSGGEPFEQADVAAEIARRVRALGLNIWTYTGYLYEDLMASSDPAVQALLAYTDVLVDGPFIEERKSLLLHFRGSDNQRIIDLNLNRLLEWDDREKRLTVAEQGSHNVNSAPP